MGLCCSTFLTCLLLACQTAPLLGEKIRLKSGKEVEVLNGQIPEKSAHALYAEAQEFFQRGRLDLARDYCQFLIKNATGEVISLAKQTQEEVTEVEYSSRIHLGNGKILTGKVFANLRRHLLGLERKEEIPIWEVEEIDAEYQAGYSQVSKTFYPTIILEIKLEGEQLQTTRMIGEVEFMVEEKDGSVTPLILGSPYKLLKGENLSQTLQELSQDRIIKVVIYPSLRFPQ